MIGTGAYGSYAALQAIVKDQSLYKCTVAFAPAIGRGERGGSHYTLNKDYEHKDVSPLNHIDKINVPVLLFHGDTDAKVNVDLSREFYKNMQKAGKDIKYTEFEFGDHNLSNQEHRIQFLKEIELFLAKNLAKNL